MYEYLFGFLIGALGTGTVIWLDDRVLKKSAKRREEKHHQEIVELKRKIFVLEQINKNGGNRNGVRLHQWSKRV